MTTRLLSCVTLGAALGAGLIAGVFFAFSNFVMPALARLPELRGMSAMQSINVTVLNRWSLGAFLGTAALCAGLAGDALLRWSAPGAHLRLAGSLLYLAGGLLVTRACNVPWNQALAALPAQGKAAAKTWASFLVEWNFWNDVRAAASFGAAALFILALSGCSPYWKCAPPDPARQGQLPDKLSLTGLYQSGDPQLLAEGVEQFAPRYELWSDGASKRRWISLPRGERIDTSDMDNWVFPVGTQLWKEFTVQGVRVETRLLRKTGPSSEDWATQAYVWLADGSDAFATPNGLSNALGTPHDVPAAGQCLACHGGRKSFALGFSALQLAYDAGPERVDLDDLVREGRITRAPGASLLIPGDDTARQALGYLHANCGHCHNQDRPAAAGSRCYNPENQLDFWLSSRHLKSVAETPTYQSGHGVAFEPGEPDGSRLLELMSERGFLRQMPPLGTENVDQKALANMRQWIANSG
jgi:uncharacterized membrane protein